MARSDLWRATLYEQNARFVSTLGDGVLDLLDPKPGERILDLGCGDGALTEKLIESGAQTIGVDKSPDMIEAARGRGVEAFVCDAAALPFSGEFDAVFSNAALHWAPAADKVAEGVARALKPGGRFVAEFGGFGNIAAIRTALIAVLSRDYGVETDLSDIWFFPTVEEYHAICERAGLRVDEIETFARPTPIKSDLAAWLDTLAAPVLARIPEDQRATARDAAARLAAPALTNRNGDWIVDYVRLRVMATKVGA